MSGQIDSEEALQKSKVLFERKRLVTISNALQLMEKNAKQYLEQFEQSPDYRLFRTQFRQYQHTSQLDQIVQFQLCDLSDPDISFYRQAEKKILVCYNKIRDYAHFQQIMKYDLTFLYDDLRAKIDWYDCSMLSCMKIRGLNISGRCKQSDKQCFIDEVRTSLERSEVCKGKYDEYFEKSFKQCVMDIAPINSVQQTKKTIFF
ncbi:unnamed protein product (macronuclear) [Paramecium tetraurelia]|uniref:Mitochondrial inner membrane protease ATP23 n=1 Tax=Paramecium tetraurelia TaxID=5888 RepID=A0CDE6_PARTE|nr:uncharacterized protein GSPATT00007024001 [Paramecium tetraurelia]CAK68813.1 unnamed protein product [Paramecium tetraurelia]|eukprot:XP_001436210.1 hypothetical protein (macronuclear) [Paramecium tetraurelia strain d4-2]